MLRLLRKMSHKAPKVTKVTPSHGPAGGGIALTINGANFQHGAMVTIGIQPATNVVVVSSSVMTCVAPAEP